jgi:hypothetical protein
VTAGIVRVSKKHKVMSEDARKSVPMKDGQEVLEIALGDVIFVVPLPTEPDKILHKYLGKYHFNRKLRKQAETMMVKEAAKSKF